MMQKRISEILRRIIGDEVPLEVIVSEGEGKGDYATPLAFRLAKMRGMAPMIIAQELKEKIENDKEAQKLFERIEVASPGFINFTLSQESLSQTLRAILKEKKNYGKPKLKSKEKKKIQVEFISANPTGPLTLANGRGGFLGDVLANMFLWMGHKVEREYYVNDTGNQILTFGKSFLAARGIIPDEETFYKGDYIKEWAEKNKKIIEKYKKNPLVLGKYAAHDFLKKIKDVVQKKSGIRFNRYTSEDELYKKKFPEKVLAIFKKNKVAYEREGAVWLKTTDYHDDKDRVLIKSDGEKTYFLADAGHYLETAQRGFDLKINILGPDHYGYVVRIQAAAKLVGMPASEVIVTQAIRLIRDGEEFKMSKRKGKFVTFEELVEDVGVDVARFIFLSVAPDTHIDFDIGRAKERSMKNPVYYVQYAAVRAKNILTKVRAHKKKLSQVGKPDFSLLTSKEERMLILKLLSFSEVMEEVVKTRGVHLLTRYASELARTFHAFYEKAHVVGELNDIASARVALLQATLIIFQNLFDILGISLPDKM